MQSEPPGKNTINNWKRLRKELRKKLATHGSDSKKGGSVQFTRLEEAVHVWVVQRGAPMMTKVLLE